MTKKWDKSLIWNCLMFIYLGFMLESINGITAMEWKFWVIVLPIIFLNIGQKLQLVKQVTEECKNDK